MKLPCYQIGVICHVSHTLAAIGGGIAGKDHFKSLLDKVAAADGDIQGESDDPTTAYMDIDMTEGEAWILAYVAAVLHRFFGIAALGDDNFSEDEKKAMLQVARPMLELSKSITDEFMPVEELDRYLSQGGADTR